GCAAFWLGSLLPLLLATGRSEGEGMVLGERFSAAALVSTNLLLVAGFMLAWAQVGIPAHLLDTAYGERLLIKFGLVAAMLALAAINFLLLTPRFRAGAAGARQALKAALARDLVLAAGVVGMPASLQLDPPPRSLPP